MRRVAIAASVALVLAAGAAHEIQAENTKGRWQLGGGLSFVSTQDDIRSNAAFVNYIQPGPDGIPNTGDETIVGYDPRNDDTLSREATLQEGLRFDLNFSYGLTDWLSLQVDTGYYDANLVQLDTYVKVVTRRSIDGVTWEPDVFDEFTQSQPIVAGSVRQIPLTVSMVFRFLRDSPVNPYFGVGGGVVFVDATPSAAFLNLDQQLYAADSTPEGITSRNSPTGVICANNCDPYGGTTLQTDNATQWQLMAGLEYFVNSKFSVYFDVRYNRISEYARVDVDGNDQVTFVFPSPADNLPQCIDGSLDGYFALRNDTPPWDRRGRGIPGICTPLDSGSQDSILVQGGSINLSAFNVALGVRWTF